MYRKFAVTASAAVLLLLLAVTIDAKVGTKADLADQARVENITRFNMPGPHEFMSVYSEGDQRNPNPVSVYAPPVRRSVGSATSPDVGPGIGTSIALTWDDQQVFYPVGRHISHWWNGEAGETNEVEVHFTYEMTVDTLPGDPWAVVGDTIPYRQTGYNVYVATVPTANWPRDQDIGCVLQATDTIGMATGANIALRPNGLATMIAAARFYAPTLSDGTYYVENMLYYQGSQWSCTYDPRSALNTSFIDSTKYKPHWAGSTLDGNHADYPQVASQVDGGGNVITHVLLAEKEAFEILGTPEWADDVDYRTFAYFRKVGDGPAGTWSAGQVIDTIERNFADMAADPFGSRVVIAYSNPSYYGRLLNNGWDKDCYYRESTDYGVTWNAVVNVTNYLNAITGVPHFSMYYETKALYSSDGNLHILFQQTPASANPYFDGYNWRDFNQDIAHWDRTSDAYVRVANGTYMNDDYLTGSINTIHCGFGGDPATYTQFFNLSECDGKLYAVWNQIHPWANYGDYTIQPEILTDCAYTGNRLNMANHEIMMSVAALATPTLWDPPRHISNTFTPDCGLPGDPLATGGVCGNEYKPYVEHYALNEAGMDLTWPASSLVDMTPEGDPPYAGSFYLNAEYMDDQFPGGSWNPNEREPNSVNSLNSMKWLRIACVEPVEASLIEARPASLNFPLWVKFGETDNYTVTVRNSGNVPLNVSQIGTVGGAWLSVSSPSGLVVPAGVVNTGTFDIIISGVGISTTQFLEGEVYLKSDAANNDSLSIKIKILAANHVEAVAWDTATTHHYMFDEFFEPEGEVIALAVSNFGEVGYGALTQGSVNLDYKESGLECGTRDRDEIYMFGGTAYALTATTSGGAGVELTQSFNDANQADETGWDPTNAKGSITGGLTGGGAYDSVYTGRFVNRDTTIAMERIVYAPRSSTPLTSILNFMIVYTKVYSADGQPHNHLTFGNAADFDVPASDPPNNNSAVSVSGNFVYLQGTDTAGWAGCQPNTTRFGTEAFGGGYTSAEFQANNCVNGLTFHASRTVYQLLLEDTTHLRNGTDLIPDQPNPVVWWDEVTIGGVSASDLMDTDLALITTYVHDYDLAATDTLHYWTVLSTVRDGTIEDLESQVAYAKNWYMQTVRGCGGGCCVGRVGDANNSGEDEPTIGDVTVMIDAKFISGTCDGIIVCLTEADINQSGGATATCEDISIGDITILIDYLFITGQSLGLPNCL
ncbi:MAG: hypothetical protein AB1772_11995 [Candidatus Zixiibacteriota bacterium]